MKSVKKISEVILEHRYGLLVAFLVGFIFFLPYLLIPILQDEGVEYSPLVVKGVAGRLTDEALYAGYVHDVMEGHLIPRSTVWEWQEKTIPSHAGPLPGMVLGGLGIILGGLTQIYTLSFFIFPFIGSLLVYAIAFRLTLNKKISCMAAPLLYCPATNLFYFITHTTIQPIGYFSRFYPVMFNFIVFALALLFLLLLLQKREWKYVFLSGITGGLLFFTYFYYWTFYAVMAVIILLLTLTVSKKISLLKTGAYFLIVFSFGITNFLLFTRHNLGDKTALLLRLNGAKFTHIPEISYSALLLVVTFFYICYNHYSSKRVEQPEQSKENFLFIITLLFSRRGIYKNKFLTGFCGESREGALGGGVPIPLFANFFFLGSAPTAAES